MRVCVILCLSLSIYVHYPMFVKWLYLCHDLSDIHTDLDVPRSMSIAIVYIYILHDLFNLFQSCYSNHDIVLQML